MRALVVMAALLGLIGGGAWYYVKYMAVDTPTTFRTTTVKQGDLTSVITATGTLEPEEVIDVGAQVVGRIKLLGPDLSDPQGKKTIDFGSEIKEGALLAQIDDAVYAAQLAQADASVVRAQADLVQSNAKLEQAEQAWRRAENLRPSKAIAETDYDLALANYKSAKATVAVSEASIKQAEAARQLAKTNLDYTVIRSPVNGVIINRRVSVGQTIVSSMNASSIALIAKDLRRMDVWAAVNEADIGRIHLGQTVRFTVDTFPKEVFQGTVKQIRLNASMTQNVVTYTVVVSTDNSSLKLLPYLTATLQFEVEKRSDVLSVSNAALRWKPRSSQIAPDLQESLAAAKKDADGKAEAGGKGEGTGKSEASGKREWSGRERSGSEAAGAAKAGHLQKNKSEKGRLWIAEGGFVRPIEVQTGINDGVATEVSGEGLRDGMEVVVGEVVAVDTAADASNPFAPKMFRGSRKGL